MKPRAVGRNLAVGLVVAGFAAFIARAADPPAGATQDAHAAAEGKPAAPPPGWKLVWSDEFDGSKIDKTKWGFDRGTGFKTADTNEWISGWGNNELEFYTDRHENAYVKDGALHIRAVKESYQGSEFTSARLVTRGLFKKAYGRFEFRAKAPVGRGLWPGLWLMPADNAYGVWAASGEIDVMEARGQHPSQVLGTILYGSRWPGFDFSEADIDLPENQTIADFHVYALEWEPGQMRWYVDDHLYSVKRHWWSSSVVNGQHEGLKRPGAKDQNAWPAPFDKPFYLIMNLAVGGNFLGGPDDQTAIPAELLIDYVRVYDKVGGYGNLPPQGKDDGLERNGTEEANAAADEAKNLALHKPATASSQENDEHAPSKANDGNGDTRWCAAGGEVPQWWQVDLQKPSDLAGVLIKWEMSGRIYQYVVEGSADAQAWVTLSDQSHTTSAWQMQKLKFDATGLRYVRVRLTGLESGTWASICEIKVLAP